MERKQFHNKKQAKNDKMKERERDEKLEKIKIMFL